MNGAKEFELLEKLGEGSFGNVYKARMIKTDQIVAVKLIKIYSETEEGIPSSILREVAVLNKLNHENIIKYLINYLGLLRLRSIIISPRFQKFDSFSSSLTRTLLKGFEG